MALVETLALVLCGLGVTISIAEEISTWLMLPWTLRIAVPVMRRSFPRHWKPLPRGNFETDNVKARQLGRNEWLFRHKWRFVQWRAPFTISGVVRVEEGAVVCQGRQTWGAWFFYAGVVIAVPAADPTAADIAFVTLFLAVMIGFSFVLHRERFREDCRVGLIRFGGHLP